MPTKTKPVGSDQPTSKKTSSRSRRATSSANDPAKARAHAIELRWSGDLDLTRAAALHRELRDAFTQADEITVALRDVGLLDLSFLQILLAAQRSSRRAHKRLRLHCAEADARRVREVWQQAGLEPEYDQLLDDPEAATEAHQ